MHVHVGDDRPAEGRRGQHENWTVSAVDFQKRMGLTGAGHATDGASLFHANAQVLLRSGGGRAAVVIYERFSSSRWWEWCRAHDITEFNAMGSMLKMLDNRPESSDDADNPCRTSLSAGTPPELIESFEERFGLVSRRRLLPHRDPLLVLNPVDEGKRRIGSIGPPPAEKRIRIVDEDGTDVPRGERGEIVQRCPAVMPVTIASRRRPTRRSSTAGSTPATTGRSTRTGSSTP